MGKALSGSSDGFVGLAHHKHLDRLPCWHAGIIPPGVGQQRRYPAVCASGEVLPLLTEPAVVLIRVDWLIENHLRLKGMANSDIQLTEPAGVGFQQVSLPNRNLHDLSSRLHSTRINYRRSFNNSSGK